MLMNPAMKTANVPGPGGVSLDHTGHFVASAEAAREALEGLGFTVTPYSAQVQPDPETGQERLTGTGNVCVMLPAGYLECLVHTADTPIGREFLAALDRRPGLHLAAFGVADAAARHAELMTAGIPMRPLVRFSRQVETADGHETAAFTVARLAADSMQEGRVQILTQHSEGALWQPRWTRHANGAQALQALLVSAPDPAEAAARFGRLLDRDAVPFGAGLRIALDRGAVEFLPEDAATDLVGAAVELGRSCFIGIRIGVADVSVFRERPGAKAFGDAIALPFHPALGRGVWLFENA